MAVCSAIDRRLARHLALAGKRIAQLRTKRAPRVQAGERQLPPAANSNAPARSQTFTTALVLEEYLDEERCFWKQELIFQGCTAGRLIPQYAFTGRATY